MRSAFGYIIPWYKDFGRYLLMTGHRSRLKNLVRFIPKHGNMVIMLTVSLDKFFYEDDALSVNDLRLHFVISVYVLGLRFDFD